MRAMTYATNEGTYSLTYKVPWILPIGEGKLPGFMNPSPPVASVTCFLKASFRMSQTTAKDHEKNDILSIHFKVFKVQEPYGLNPRTRNEAQNGPRNDQPKTGKQVVWG